MIFIDVLTPSIFATYTMGQGRAPLSEETFEKMPQAQDESIEEAESTKIPKVNEEVLQTLIGNLESGGRRVRESAAEALGGIGYSENRILF